MQDVEGKKLFAEAFYLYGCMLLLMDTLLPGPSREKLIIAYYRYKGGQTAITYINEVTKLCSDTGFTPDGKRPELYPEEYLGRFPLPEDLMVEVINSIKDDDIYKFTAIYPSADHRSIALANQGAILYVLLYLCPRILQREKVNSSIKLVQNERNCGQALLRLLGDPILSRLLHRSFATVGAL